MTPVQALITETQKAGIALSVAGERLRVQAPAGALTPELKAALTARKPELLAVLWRLAGMRQHTTPVPTAKAAQDAPGGPGHCFSCGDPHEHPEAYGRCAWCDIAVEAYYAVHHDDEVAGGGSHRRVASSGRPWVKPPETEGWPPAHRS